MNNKLVLYHIVATILRSFVAIVLLLRGAMVYNKFEEGKWLCLLYGICAIALWELCYEDYKEVKRRHSKPLYYSPFIFFPIHIVNLGVQFYSSRYIVILASSLTPIFIVVMITNAKLIYDNIDEDDAEKIHLEKNEFKCNKISMLDDKKMDETTKITMYGVV